MAKSKKAIEVTEVKLLNSSTKEEQTFTFSHAESILQLQERKDYDSFTLPEGSEYEYIGGKLIKKK